MQRARTLFLDISLSRIYLRRSWPVTILYLVCCCAEVALGLEKERESAELLDSGTRQYLPVRT